MKKVLVTGSDGFIGRNLVQALARRSEYEVLEYDVQHSRDVLTGALAKADIVFHLAGVNRPDKLEEFETGNVGFARELASFLEQDGRTPLVVLSSSIQALLDNPYGRSKRGAEIVLEEWAGRTGASVLVYRFPNVFGKWCRPNYNSAVATFCHNIAHGLPITVNDPEVVLELVYIDDIVDELIRAMAGHPTREGRFCAVPVTYKMKLGRIADLIRSFRESREERGLPDVSDPFTAKLYATYLSYLPEDGFSYPLKMNMDARGSFTEMFRTPERGQISVNISKPGITKGNHWHNTKNEKFIVVFGTGVIRFRRIGDTKVIEYQVGGDRIEVVDIPTGYTHNITNTGDADMVTIMWASECFDPDRPDTYYEEV